MTDNAILKVHRVMKKKRSCPFHLNFDERGVDIIALLSLVSQMEHHSNTDQGFAGQLDVVWDLGVHSMGECSVDTRTELTLSLVFAEDTAVDSSRGS